MVLSRDFFTFAAKELIMKKLLIVIVVILLFGYLISYSPIKIAKQSEKELDTLIQINNNDTMFFIVNKNYDTVDWYGHSKGVWISKKQYEQALDMADSLIKLGYRKGCINNE